MTAEQKFAIITMKIKFPQHYMFSYCTSLHHFTVFTSFSSLLHFTSFRHFTSLRHWIIFTYLRRYVFFRYLRQYVSFSLFTPFFTSWRLLYVFTSLRHFMSFRMLITAKYYSMISWRLDYTKNLKIGIEELTPSLPILAHLGALNPLVLK